MNYQVTLFQGRKRFKMNGREHIVFATATAAGVITATQGVDIAFLSHPYIVVGATVLGSLLPDIDNTESTIGKVLFPIAIVIQKLFGHRMITHDVLIQIPLMIAAFTYAFVSGNPIVFGLALGIVSHLFLDSLTKMGLPVGSFIWKEKRYSFSQVSAKYYVHLLPKCLTVKSGSFLSVVETLALSVGSFAATSYLATLI